MCNCRRLLTLFCAALLFATARSPSGAPAAEQASGNIAGILFDKKDDFLTVKADGEDEVVKYQVSKDDKRLAASLKSIFPASRVQLSYKKDGDNRQLVAIKRQVLKATGTVTGEVVKVHNDFWVEVKPKNGLADAFAPGANYKDKEFMAKLKGLKKGDSVTITYYTDFERHRIQMLPLTKPRTSEQFTRRPLATLRRRVMGSEDHSEVLTRRPETFSVRHPPNTLLRRVANEQSIFRRTA